MWAVLPISKNLTDDLQHLFELMQPFWVSLTPEGGAAGNGDLAHWQCLPAASELRKAVASLYKRQVNKWIFVDATTSIHDYLLGKLQHFTNVVQEVSGFATIIHGHGFRKWGIQSSSLQPLVCLLHFVQKWLLQRCGKFNECWNGYNRIQKLKLAAYQTSPTKHTTWREAWTSITWYIINPFSIIVNTF